MVYYIDTHVLFYKPPERWSIERTWSMNRYYHVNLVLDDLILDCSKEHGVQYYRKEDYLGSYTPSLVYTLPRPLEEERVVGRLEYIPIGKKLEKVQSILSFLLPHYPPSFNCTTLSIYALRSTYDIPYLCTPNRLARYLQNTMGVSNGKSIQQA